MQARLRSDAGFGLVELVIALTVTTVGIFAVVAGFSSGFSSINRASKTSTAGAVADAQMESFRRLQYSALPDGLPLPGGDTTSSTTTGPDGRTYWVGSTVTLGCISGTIDLVAVPPACPDVATNVKSRPLKTVTVTVREGSSTGAVLIAQSTTIDQSTG
jgi:type II secretory pathway pseudopilin PulG